MEKKDTTEQEGVHVYEVGYLLVPTIAEEQVAAEVESLKEIIVKTEGTIISEDFPSMRDLAYTMAKSANGALKQKFDKAYFGWVKFETSAQGAETIKAEIDKKATILRYLLISTVRENTMISQKSMFKAPEGEKAADTTDASSGPATAVPVNEEELDKTLENIVV